MYQTSFESNLERFNRYVMNEIPIRLIRLSDMKFVARNDMRKHFRGSVPEDDLEMRYSPSNTVKYAILSHRWLDEGEPTYEGMKSGIAAGPGYEKLKKFCEKALTYGVEFAWSDTCCIDKSSSTELDESIRSMFRWYENSEICIIHLAQSETIEDIMDDEWMKRGWTLQELLAPRKIKLFSSHWLPMTDDRNDKSHEETKMMKTLERATGIPLDDISIYFSGSFGVDRRMAWAARRKTTRVEDVAYSLMGIFDVSLQIAYGEGGDRAFCRLIEAIMQSGNPSVLNWTGEAAFHPSFSCAIPKSPQNYEGLTRFPNLCQLEMTMTSLGLRVPLVVLPLSISSSIYTEQSEFEERVSQWKVTLECPLCPTIRINFTEYEENSNCQYALGIVNYSLGSCDVPRIPGQSVGFILRRAPEYRSMPRVIVCKPRSEHFPGLKTVFPESHECGQWSKANMTGLVEVNFPEIPSHSYFHISREYVEIVYL
ncbi:hypothetical protein K503DRAFT_771461 [Rhizopogon vinicolor AM-OR11-026]|uniref:Heterokaryon incompatibility domain-containing protein n=1 Tax=Rhizopogon vinicolor AM-OR11-026 TaxID=1314800 RepID=A0A1B7MXX6_9AGAM|nr:hypothetical protein K503DRAFT_771461 [Rhizopogon vinicolor AM-OR11-026]